VSPRLRAVVVVSVALGCGPPVIEPRPLAPPPKARADKAGPGFVLVDRPEGERVCTAKSGRAAVPKVTADFHDVPTSNSWWSSLIWQFSDDDPYSNNLYAHPLALRAQPDGLALSYPSEPAVGKREYMYRFAEDLRVGPLGMKSRDTRVASYSDWAVTAAWSSDRGELRATFGHGLPFVYLTKTDPAPLVIRAAPGKHLEIDRDLGEVLGVTVGGHHYGIFAPPKGQWTRDGGSLSSDLAAKGYASIAVLPDDKPETLELFRRHAYAFVTGTRVTYRYDEARAELETTFAVQTEPRVAVGTWSGDPLIALYRHQWLHTSAKLEAGGYASPRGAMKLIAASAFTVRLPFPGVLPILPNVDSSNRAELLVHVNRAARSDDLFPPGLGPGRAKDAYWVGKSLGRNASLLAIADQLGAREARARLLVAIENELADWFDGEAPSHFYYDRAWRSLVALPGSYGSSEHLNDHHFHYGYFIAAAAAVARFDPAWASRWAPFVELLIKDVANWDRRDTRFPFLRHMDTYAGHSWASGPAQFEDGNNEEASSEDINFSAAVVLWGAATHRRDLRDLGIFLYAHQVAAVEQYWFDVDHAVFPRGFEHSAAAMVWGAGAKHDTWFDQDPIFVHGIDFLPFTGASLYLGRRPDYVRKNFDEVFRESRGIVTTWRDYLAMYIALAEPKKAGDLFRDDPYLSPEFGNSKAMTHHWISNLSVLGGVDPAIQADLPTYAVFKNGAARTYVAWNPEPEPRRVRFSDGTAIAVGARELGVVRNDQPTRLGMKP
jgi:endoglucanase Acf2